VGSALLEPRVGRQTLPLTFAIIIFSISDAGGDFAPPSDNLVGEQNSGGRRGSDCGFWEASEVDT
jgi:hypothetical protein